MVIHELCPFRPARWSRISSCETAHWVLQYVPASLSRQSSFLARPLVWQLGKNRRVESSAPPIPGGEPSRMLVGYVRAQMETHCVAIRTSLFPQFSGQHYGHGSSLPRAGGAPAIDADHSAVRAHPTCRKPWFVPDGTGVRRLRSIAWRCTIRRMRRKSEDRSITASEAGDRKSTRLNSSHGYISYAVFCLKKKKKQNAR